MFIEPPLCARWYSGHLEYNHKQNKDVTKILARGLLYCNIPPRVKSMWEDTYSPYLPLIIKVTNFSL